MTCCNFYSFETHAKWKIISKKMHLNWWGNGYGMWLCKPLWVDKNKFCANNHAIRIQSNNTAHTMSGNYEITMLCF